jgi:hypothetical protein
MQRKVELTSFFLSSYAVALLELALIPPLAMHWFPWRGISDGAYMLLILALSNLWLIIVGFGFKRWGWWPAILMLPAAPLGGLAFTFIIVVFTACMAGDQCL